MANETVTRGLYERLMRVNEEAFAAGLYNAAYHALAAALHCARELKDDAALRRVENRARQQLTWIDANAPGYEHSSESASSRGHKSIFEQLAAQAATQLEIDSIRKAKT